MGSIIGGNRSVAAGALGADQAFDVATFAKRFGGVTISPLKADAVLYSQGEPAEALFYLDSGQIEITVVSSQGKEGILAVLDAGEFCGESCILPGRTRIASAHCLADSSVARLERANVLHAIREDSAVAEFFVGIALRSVVRLRENLISQLFDSSERRLARILLVLANNGDNARRRDTIRNVDQEALSQMIGTTRSRVNHFMNKFRDAGLIDYDGTAIQVRHSLLETALRQDSFDMVEHNLRRLLRRPPVDRTSPKSRKSGALRRATSG